MPRFIELSSSITATHRAACQITNQPITCRHVRFSMTSSIGIESILRLYSQSSLGLRNLQVILSKLPAPLIRRRTTPSMAFDKPVAIVVGASRGIGRQVAIDLAKNGYSG
jgi:hypothetical protein